MRPRFPHQFRPLSLRAPFFSYFPAWNSTFRLHWTIYLLVRSSYYEHCFLNPIQYFTLMKGEKITSTQTSCQAISHSSYTTVSTCIILLIVWCRVFAAIFSISFHWFVFFAIISIVIIRSVFFCSLSLSLARSASVHSQSKYRSSFSMFCSSC